MICNQDIDRLQFPEIGGRDIEDCRERQLAINSVRWLASEILSLFEMPIKLIAIISILWPVILYG